jgi:hypothetical protein
MRRTFGLLLLLPFLTGCGGGKSKVSGQVRFNGDPLPGGVLTFQPADPKHNSVAVSLDEQGHYEATLPVGEVQVSVENRHLQPRSAGPRGVPPSLPPEVQEALGKAKPQAAPPPPVDKPAAKPRGNYVPIPEKYSSIETSGLTFTVAPGNPTHDIELTANP